MTVGPIVGQCAVNHHGQRSTEFEVYVCMQISLDNNLSVNILTYPNISTK